MKSTKFCHFLAFLILSACSHTRYFAGAGVYSPAIKKLAQGEQAEIALFAPWTFPLSLRAQSKLLFTEFSSTPFPSISPDRGIWTFVSQNKIGMSPDFLRLGSLRFEFYSLIHLQTQRGLGKAVTLDNGLSTTTFYTPSVIRNSILLGLGTQLSLSLTDHIQFSLGSDLLSPFTKNSQQWTFFGTLWYKIGESR